MMYDCFKIYFEVAQKPIIMLNFEDEVKLTPANSEFWEGKNFADYLPSKCLISVVNSMNVA